MSSNNNNGKRRVFVIGVGMTPFVKPKAEAGDGPHFHELAKIAVERAIKDSTISKNEIEQAFVGNMFVNGAGQRALYHTGIYGIPIHNVHNACATGSNALFLAKMAVQSGINECALALGVEKMKPGSLGGGKPTGEPTGLDNHYRILNSKVDLRKAGAPPMPIFFGAAGVEHMKLYGSTAEQFAMIGEKNHRHSANNPYAQFRDIYTLDQVKNSPKVFEMLTKLQCSPTSDGAGAAIVASEAFVKAHGLEGQAIEIIGQSMRTDEPITFEKVDLNNPRVLMNLIGAPMAKRAADDAFKQAGITPNDVQVVELHDCFSANELITYESLGLCKEGEGGKLVESGNCTYGGKYVINPSGGLISKGHPLGATGLAQCAELCWQLRGEAGPRQVKNAKVGLQHNLGLGGAVVVTIYRQPEEWKNIKPKRETSGAMGFPDDKDIISPPVKAKL